MEAIYGDTYVPGDPPEFNPNDGKDWDPPQPRKRRKARRAIIVRDPVTRHLILALRRDLHYIFPNGTIPEVPDIFGGPITVETYVARNYPDAIAFMGLTVSSKILLYQTFTN